MEAVFAARKPMTLLGVNYAAGEPVPLDGLEPGLRQRLVQLRRVVPRDVGAMAERQTSADTVELSAALNAGGSVVTGQSINGAAETTAVLDGRCGDFGGVSKNGAACGNRVYDGRLCHRHRN